MSKAVAASMEDVEKKLAKVIGKTTVDLTIFDPKTVTDEGQPVRLVRRAETNLADLVTDSYRAQTGADVAIAGGGTIRADIPAGDITKGDVLSAMPFTEDLCVCEVTGQQILDALEWGVHKMPDEFGGFMQVSGMSYEIDMSVPSSCTADENGLFAGVDGERRVKNVMVGDKPIDPAGTYTLASDLYHITEQGDGFTMFSEENVVRTVMVDNESVMKYIEETLNGVVGEEYADPYGHGRITAVE
jgi:2',3'-cyclic-nucleotide 2'-phosphodiesterase (5'-nucleotidase family)